MNRSHAAAGERGVVLFLSLIMLLTLTVLGVSAFQNAHLQERSAGNARLQSVAFEAAAAGASNAINFFDANRALGPDQLCGTTGHAGWAEPSSWVDMGMVGEAYLQQRLYCLADEYPCTEDDVDCDVRPPRSQLFVLSHGEVRSGAAVVAQRDVEVRLDIGGTWSAGDGCGAICFPSCTAGTLNFPNSNTFQVDGNGGYAITGGCQAMADAVRNGIRNNRIGNYLGGIGATTPGSPWAEPTTVEMFRVNIAAAALAAQGRPGACMTFCFSPVGVNMNSNSAFGTVAHPQITYIEGNASFGGNISGAGIMFVRGNLSWNGTPNFKGLIVTLGGTFTAAGGGLGGDHGGSLVILNHPLGGGGFFGPSNFNNTGGGTALFKFDCQALWLAHGLLDQVGQSLWSPECDVGPQSVFQAGPEDLIIASWRENIGWREEFFGSGD